MTHNSQETKLFGTSGIRGSIDGFLTPEFAVKAGLTFATLLGNKGHVLVGRDVRAHSQLIQSAFFSGLLAGGVDATDCHIVPTPALLFALKKFGYAGAVSVTGSHTPAPTTGILLFLSDSGEMDEHAQEQFEDILRSRRYRRSSWNQAGSLSTLDISETYLDEILRALGNVGGYRVVVDPGNGAACQTLGRILGSVGCEVVTINGTPDGTFPSQFSIPATKHADPAIFGSWRKRS